MRLHQLIISLMAFIQIAHGQELRVGEGEDERILFLNELDYQIDQTNAASFGQMA
jgi:hypothetical protein